MQRQLTLKYVKQTIGGMATAAKVLRLEGAARYVQAARRGQCACAVPPSGRKRKLVWCAVGVAGVSLDCSENSA
ncbi:unnamed protein product [Caretta caretta]